MNKNFNEQNINEEINLAISIIKEKFPECDAKKMIIQHLEIFNGFSMNMYAVSLAMMKIRVEARIDNLNKLNPNELLMSLKKIEVIADNMHNVGSFLASGTACDAMSMLYQGFDEKGLLKAEVIKNIQGN